MPIPLLYHAATAESCPAGATLQECGVQTPICPLKGANRLVLVAGQFLVDPVYRELAWCQNGLLDFLPKKFNKDVADECGYKSDHKIGRRKNIPDGPNQTLALTHTRAFKFAH